MKNLVGQIRRDRIASGEAPPDNLGNFNKDKIWTKEEDDKIAEIMIESTMNGDLIKDAMEKASNALDNRTVGSINMRWNTVIKREYLNEFEEAKKIGEEIRKKKVSELAKERWQNKSEEQEPKEVQLTFSVPLYENTVEGPAQDPEILEQNDIDDKMLRVTINIIMDRLELMQSERDHYRTLYEKEKEKTEKMRKIFEEV
jgi:hypothetical protein